MNNKPLRLASAILTGLILTAAALCWGGTSRAQEGTIYCVNQSGTGCAAACNGGCFKAVQAAIDAASSGAEIRIAAGTYQSAAKNVAVITKELSLKGGFDSTCDAHDPEQHQSVLDGQRQGSVISIANASNVVLEFLSVTNGNGNGVCSAYGCGCGGGIYAKNTSLHAGNCVISNNIGNMDTAVQFGSGGGVFADGGDLEIRDSQIISNTANFTSSTVQNLESSGGGVSVWNGNNVVIVRNNIANNLSDKTSNGGMGGGVHFYNTKNVQVLSNTIQNNKAAVEREALGSGGGINVLSSTATIAGNRIESNWTNPAFFGYGGGIDLAGASNVTVTRNVISGNVAMGVGTDRDAMGGGVLNFLNSKPVTLSNNLIVNNIARAAEGGGVYIVSEGSSVLVNNTIANNGDSGVGAALQITAALTLTNNLIVSHTTGITAYDSASAAIITADHNLFHNTADPITGANAILADPKLSPDYRLYDDSPAVNAGLPIPWLTVDLAGAPRPQGVAWDIGAYEGSQEAPAQKIYLPLVLKN